MDYIGEIMADKNNGILKALLIGVAAIGGTLLIADILNNFGKKKKVYKCPNCNSDIDYHLDKCLHCSTNLEWDF